MKDEKRMKRRDPDLFYPLSSILYPSSFILHPSSLIPHPSSFLNTSFFLQHAARLNSRARINRRATFFDVANDPILVYYERCPATETLGLIEDAVFFDHSSFEITQERKAYTELFRPMSISGNTINTNSKDLCFCFVEFCDISLIRFHLLFSATGEGEHKECQHDIFFSFEVA